MVLLHRGIDGAQLGASLIEGDTGSETPEEFGHAMDAPGDHGCGQMMRAGDHVGDDFSILGIWHAGFEDADDCRRPITYATQANGFADDGRIFL